MARIVVYSLDGFMRAVSRLARPQTTVYIIPKTTSRHRHYIQYTASSPEELDKLLHWLRQQGFDPIEGYVQEVVA